MRIYKKIFYCYALFLSLALSGCVSSKSVNKEVSEVPIEQLYSEGVDALNNNDYKQSSAKFSKLYEEYPFSDLANKSMFMDAYVKFKSGKYKDAIDICENFIRTFPADENISYIYYLRAISSYNTINSIRLDQSDTEMAKEYLQELVNKFPNSPYSEDANAKLKLTYDYLAAKELDIGRFYLKRKEIIAAIKHLSIVVENYQNTSHIEETLHRLVECYMILDIKAEAEKYADILRANYPKSMWTQHSLDLLNGQTLPKK